MLKSKNNIHVQNMADDHERITACSSDVDEH